MRTIIVLAIGIALAVVGANAGRIVGGSVTSIDQYPFSAALLRSFTGSGTFHQACGGFIINNRAVATAAHCFDAHSASRFWRVRVGSTRSDSGGSVYNTYTVIRHASYNTWTLDNDIAVLRISGSFSFNNNIRAGSIAGPNYHVADNAPVWVVGWGALYWEGPGSPQLRHVQVWIINQATCRTRYAQINKSVTDNMICSGYLNVGGRDACQGDSGGPVIHNNVIVGVTSWGEECAHPHYPGVNARVSRYTSWIQSNQ